MPLSRSMVGKMALVAVTQMGSMMTAAVSSVMRCALAMESHPVSVNRKAVRAERVAQMYRAAMMHSKAMSPTPNAEASSMKSSERAMKTATAMPPTAKPVTSAECGMKAATSVASATPAMPSTSAAVPTTSAAFREYRGTAAHKAKCANCNGRR